MESISAQIVKDLEAKLTRKKLKAIEVEFMEMADKLKNRDTKASEPPSDRATFVKNLSRDYARRTGKSTANMRGKTTNIERTKISSGKGGTSLRFVNRESGKIFNFHDKGTARGGKVREIYEKRAKFVAKPLRDLLRNGVYEVLNGKR